MAESEKELISKFKIESEKMGLCLNRKKAKILTTAEERGCR